MSTVVDYGGGSFAALPDMGQLDGGEMLCGGTDESLWRGADGKFYHVYRVYDPDDDITSADDIREVTEEEALELVAQYAPDEKKGAYWWLRAQLRPGDEKTSAYVKKVAGYANPCYYDEKTLVLRIPATAGGLVPVTMWWTDSAGDEPFIVGTARDVLTEEPTGCADVTSALQARRWLHWCEDEQHPAYLWEPGTGPRDVTHPDEKPTPEETHIERLARELAELEDINSIREVMRAGVAAAEKIASEEGNDSGGQGKGDNGWKR